MTQKLIFMPKLPSLCNKMAALVDSAIDLDAQNVADASMLGEARAVGNKSRSVIFGNRWKIRWTGRTSNLIR
jgi:hypothetical protein